MVLFTKKTYKKDDGFLSEESGEKARKIHTYYIFTA